MAITKVLRYSLRPMLYGAFVTGALATIFISMVLSASAEAGPQVSVSIHNAGHATTTSAALGSVVHATVLIATTTGTTTPTGTVDFKRYANLTCSDAAVVQGGVALINGSAESATTTVGASGLSYRVVYNGDAANAASESSCVSVTPTASPSLSTALSSSTVLVGAFVHDTAALGGATANASGTVAYTVYTNSACSAGAQGAGVKTVTNASVPNSESIQFNTPGTYYWQAVYSGDGQNAAATSTCTSEPLLVLATSTPTGRIIVDKVTNPAGATTTFNFDAQGEGYADFSLTDSAAPNSQTLLPGTYRVSELGKAGWKLTSAACSHNGASSTPYTPGSALSLGANDTITCTFINTRKATTTPPHHGHDGRDDDDDDDDGDHGKHNGFVHGLPFGIFKKMFGDTDFPIPDGIEKRFLGGDFFKHLFNDNDSDDDDSGTQKAAKEKHQNRGEGRGNGRSRQ